ncbi:DUF3419 family protein [Adhaeribacter radiodurans]|uniref:DUF3419 family protein n=1 Tax=Adhaeribacter radiodurans TaxID=2745197 RepID=A0A7L7L745_9BACT|nr:DUF3419 family protein [Adhaeribacter radiodurans]QMU28169.1 DUF3419 family protein [Adhaeribacter radiodurans]
MKPETKGQVQLSKLIFTHNWEDPAMDERALQIKADDTVFTITSGGCNTLGFLRFNPRQIYCVDINAAQTYLMELKQAAFRYLDYEELLAFLGLRHHPKRSLIFRKLISDLSPEARSFWLNNNSLIEKGIIMNGRYERFVKIASWLLRTLQGYGKTKRLFGLKTLEEQKKLYDTEWNNGRWQWIFKTLFNKKRLAKGGLDGDYFHFDDGSASFSESFHKRAGHAICDLPVQTNYFLALYLLGHYQNEKSIPAYLQQENFNVIKKNIDRIHPVTADSKYWLEVQQDNLFDAMALSNICELMDKADTHKLFSEVLRTSKPGARLIFRNLMIPREVPENLQSNIIQDSDLSKEIQFQDRSFVYGKVAAYTIVK